MSANVYQMVTDRIIAELEKGLIPWRKPWTGAKEGAYNRVTGRPYSLLNQLLLKHQGEYATFKQIQEAGGHVRKGEKSEIVVFWKIQPVKEETEDGTEEIKQIPLLRYYNVFHVATQCEGIEPKPTAELKELKPIEEAEKIKEAYKEREHLKIIETVSNKAFYSPSMDYVQVPERQQYTHIEEFYSTLFHELTHSTGHKTRLNRLDTGSNAHFGSESYSKEELTAEIGSAMILNQLGIDTEKSFTNSVAYVQNWLQVLKNDNKFIVSAASRAEKAVKYIMGDSIEE